MARRHVLRQRSESTSEPAADTARARQLAVIGGIWHVLSRIVPMLATVGLSVVMARSLGSAELGQQSLVSYVEAAITAVIVHSFSDASLRSLSAAYGAGDQRRAQVLVGWVSKGHLATGVLAAGILAAVGLWSTETRELWFIVALSTLANAAAWAFSTRIVAAHGYVYVSRVRLAGQCVGQGLGVIAVLTGLGVAGVLAANVVAAVGMALAMRARVPADHAVRDRVPNGLVRLWLGFIPLVIIFQVVAQRIEFLVLGRYSTLSELAMYSVAFMVVSVAVSVPVSFVIAAAPGVARSTGAAGESATLIDHLERACRVLLVLSVPIAAALMIFGPRLVLLVYGTEFAQASSLVPVLAIGLFLVPVGQLCETYWSGLGRIGVLLVWGTVAGAIDIGAALLTVPGLGALGAAVSNVLGQLTLSVAVLAYTRRRYRGLDVGARDVARMLVLCVVPAAASYAVLTAVPGWIGLVGAAAVFCGLLLGVGSWLGLLRTADGHWLMAALPNRLTMVEPVLVGRQHVQRAR